MVTATVLVEEVRNSRSLHRFLRKNQPGLEVVGWLEMALIDSPATVKIISMEHHVRGLIGDRDVLGEGERENVNCAGDVSLRAGLVYLRSLIFRRPVGPLYICWIGIWCRC